MTYGLTDKVVLVTGGSQGQGASHVERFAREGARVVATDVLDEQGDAYVAGLVAQGLIVIYRHLDVASKDEWAAVVADIASEWGPVDILVNNAGISSHDVIDDITLGEWDKVVAVNQTGIMLGIQSVVPGMTSRGGGSIINTASSWAHRGGTENGFIAYVTTKAAVIGITKNSAMTLAKYGIRVNSVSPGYVRTAQVIHSEQVDPERVANDVAKIPMRRMARTDEIASVIAFLASDDASYITGTDILIDGGLLLS